MLEKEGAGILKRKPGIIVAMINGKRILLLERRSIPFIPNPGIWSLLTGGLKNGEMPLDAAYREINEETGILRKDIRLLAGPNRVMLTDAVRKEGRWHNTFYIFRSGTDKVKRNIENSAHRWARLEELEEEKEYTNIFMNAERIMKMLKSAIDGE